MKGTESCWELELEGKFDRRVLWRPWGTRMSSSRGAGGIPRFPLTPLFQWPAGEQDWQCPISDIPLWMCPTGWDSTENFKHATLVDFTAELLECLRGVTVYSGEQCCHAGQLVSVLLSSSQTKNNVAGFESWRTRGASLRINTKVLGRAGAIFWMSVLNNKRWQVIWMSLQCGYSDWMLTFPREIIPPLFGRMRAFFLVLFLLDSLSSANDPVLKIPNPGGSIFVIVKRFAPQISSGNDQETFVLHVKRGKHWSKGKPLRFIGMLRAYKINPSISAKKNGSVTWST